MFSEKFPELNISRIGDTKLNITKLKDAGDSKLGSLSEKYESGGIGAGAISNTAGDIGGKSYGTWQIATKTGTMDSFMSYIKTKDADTFNKLSNSGQVGSSNFDNEWKNLATSQGDRFNDLQRSFIEATHYKPAIDKIQKDTGIDFNSMNNVVKNVIWSTAVQHGSAGASNIIRNAEITKDMSSEEMIRRIYAERGADDGLKHFGGSSDNVRSSVVNRFENERTDALKELENIFGGTTNTEISKIESSLETSGFNMDRLSSGISKEEPSFKELTMKEGLLDPQIPQLSREEQELEQLTLGGLLPSGSEFLGTQPTDFEGKISDTPFTAGLLASIPLLGAGIKKQAQGELDLAKKEATVIKTFEALNEMKEFPRSRFLGTDVGEPLVYEIDRPETDFTVYHLGQLVGTGITFGLAGMAGKAVGVASSAPFANVVAKTFPKLSQATIEILTAINATGVSTATFSAITGLSSDKDIEGRVGDILGGYAFGILFGTVANANKILKNVISSRARGVSTLGDRIKMQDYKYFNDVKDVSELSARRAKYAKQYHPDINPSKDATTKMAEINAEFDDIMANMVKQVKPEAVVKTAQDFTNVEPNFNAPVARNMSAVEKMYNNTMQNGGSTVNLDGITPTKGFAVAVKGFEQVVSKSEFTMKTLVDFIARNAKELSKPENFVGTWFNEKDGKIYLDVTRIRPSTQETLDTARSEEELAVFNLENFNEIPTGFKPEKVVKTDKVIELPTVDKEVAETKALDTMTLQERVMGKLREPEKTVEMSTTAIEGITPKLMSGEEVVSELSNSGQIVKDRYGKFAEKYRITVGDKTLTVERPVDIDGMPTEKAQNFSIYTVTPMGKSLTRGISGSTPEAVFESINDELVQGGRIITKESTTTPTVESEKVAPIIESNDTIIGYHYSPEANLTIIDPSKMGTSIHAGEEMKTQFTEGKIDKGFENKANLFTKETDGLEAHRFGNMYKYETEIKANDIYDWSTNPDKLKTETAIKDSGYIGYYKNGQLRLFETTPVKLLGKGTEAKGVEALPTAGEETKNVGYHAGDLGKAKDTQLSRTSSGRSTGHYGTGTYFVGDKKILTSGSYKNRPLHEVSFDNYNLYIPENSNKGIQLHTFLANVNSYWNDPDFTFDLAKAKEKAIELEEDMSENNINYSAELEKETLTRIDKLYEMEEYTNDLLKNIENLFPMFTENQIIDAFESTRTKLSKFIGKETYMNELADGVDSASTIFMKELGYEGIDVRGIDKLDGTSYGSVIYDLKETPKVEKLPVTASKTDVIRLPDLSKRLKKYQKLQRELGDKGVTLSTKKEVELLIAEKESIPALKEAQQDLITNYKAKVKAEKIKATERVAKEKESARIASEKAKKKLAETKAKKDAEIEAQKLKTAETKVNAKAKAEAERLRQAEIRKTKTTKKAESKEKTQLLKTLKKLKKAKMTPALEDARNELVGQFDLVSKGIREKTAINLKATKQLLDEMEANGIRILDEVRKSVERLDKKHISNLTLDEVQEYKDMANHILYMNATINEFVTTEKAKSISDTIDEVVDKMDIKNVEEFKTVGNISQTKEFFFETNALTPYNNALRISGGNENTDFIKAYNRLSEGQGQTFKNAKEIEEYFEKNNINQTEKFALSLKDKPQKVTLSSGKVLNLTSGEKVSLELLKAQDSSYKTILENGFRQAGKTKPTALTLDDWNSITLNKEEQKAFNVISKFFTDISYPMINNAYAEINGFNLPRVKRYFPIVRDKLTIPESVENFMSSPTLEGAGILKARVSSTRPLMLEDVWEVVERHKTIASNYGGIAPSLHDFKRIMGNPDMKTALLKKYGAVKKGDKVVETSIMEKYFKTLFEDVEGGRSLSNQHEKIIGKFFTNMQRGVLGLNERVTAKQSMSYFMAGTEIEPKYLMKAIPKKVDVKHIAEHSPEFWLRTKGKITRESGDIESQLHKKLNIVTKPITLLDLQTVGRIWNASELQIQDTMDLKQGSEEYYEAVNKLFKKALATQPNYSILDRSGLLRDKRISTRLLTMFSSARNANYNTIAKAVIEGKKTKNWSKLKKAITGLLISSLGITSIDYLAQKARGRDYEFANGLASNIIGNVPIMDKIASKLEGYEFDSVNQQMLNDVFDDVEGLYKLQSNINSWQEDYKNGIINKSALDGKIKSNSTKAVKNLTFDISKAFGIPTKNVEGIASLILNAVNPTLGYQYSTLTDFGNRTRLYNDVAEAINENNVELLPIIVDEMKKSGVTKETLINSINKKNKDDDSTNDVTDVQLLPILNQLSTNRKTDLPEFITTITKVEKLSKLGVDANKLNKAVDAIKNNKITLKADREQFLLKSFDEFEVKKIMNIYYSYK